MKMLSEIVVTQRADRKLSALVANSTTSAGERIYRQWSLCAVV
jgi:hypothetical protein